MSNNPHIGSSFEDFLAEEGLAGEAAAAAIKRVRAWQLAEAIRETADGMHQVGIMDAATHEQITRRHSGRPISRADDLLDDGKGRADSK